MNKNDLSNIIKPENESERIKKLNSYEILDTPPENSFDKIAHLASKIFNAPIAQVTFVDENRTFFKSNISPLTASEINRADSFCTKTILNKEITYYNDLKLVPELAENPFVKMPNGVRFYAGAPLKTIEGYHLGSVCILDTIPREIEPKELRMLEILSSIVIDELELRITTRKALRTQIDFMNRVVHDLKNPNTAISVTAELLKKKANQPDIVYKFADRIKNSANNVLNSLNHLLDLSQLENEEFRLSLEESDLSELLHTVKTNFEFIALEKKQKIYIDCQIQQLIWIDKQRLQEAITNLLSNALKYSNPSSRVYITAKIIDDQVVIEVKDEGQGLREDEIPKLFVKFAKLSAIPTGREYSNGLGLSIVKILVEMHKGKVWAKSYGKNKGCSFFIALPL
jgi:signal transduction histidine kinase